MFLNKYLQILPFVPRNSFHYYKIEQIFSDLKTHAILVQIRNNWCNPQADRSSTEEKQQIFSVIENNQQILRNYNKKSQLVGIDNNKADTAIAVE